MINSIIQRAFRPLDVQLDTHEYLFGAWKETQFERGDLITEAGTIERKFYIVLEGVQCIYILTPEGDKKVIGFSYSGSFSGVYDSFLKESNSYYFLEALTPSKLIYINKEEYDSLFEKYPEFDYWGRIVHQELLIGRVNREIELITFSAKQRFDAFISRCPKELFVIPQKYIASYLNMTPETFSRLRSSIS